MARPSDSIEMADGYPRRDTRTYSILEAMKHSGSGVVRQRAAQISQPGTSTSETPKSSTGDAMHPSSHSSQRHSREIRSRPEMMGVPSLLTSNSSRSLKRKKSQSSQATDRIENKHASKPSITSSSAYASSSTEAPIESGTPPLSTSNRKGKSSISRHLTHRYDTRLASTQNIYDNMDPSSQEPVFRGPLAVAEYDRLKMEIESLKESLHEMKRSSKKQTKAHSFSIARIFYRNNNICLEARRNQDRAKHCNSGTLTLHKHEWDFS